MHTLVKGLTPSRAALGPQELMVSAHCPRGGSHSGSVQDAFNFFIQAGQRRGVMLPKTGPCRFHGGGHDLVGLAILRLNSHVSLEEAGGGS